MDTCPNCGDTLCPDCGGHSGMVGKQKQTFKKQVTWDTWYPGTNGSYLQVFLYRLKTQQNPVLVAAKVRKLWYSPRHLMREFQAVIDSAPGLQGLFYTEEGPVTFPDSKDFWAWAKQKTTIVQTIFDPMP